MSSTVYPSEEVQKAIEEYFYLVKIDIEGEGMINYLGEELTEAEFARALQNESVPTTYFLDDRGAIIGDQPGFLEPRSEEHTSELQSRGQLVCRLVPGNKEAGIS